MTKLQLSGQGFDLSRGSAIRCAGAVRGLDRALAESFEVALVA
jgi:hypothetical protein